MRWTSCRPWGRTKGLVHWVVRPQWLGALPYADALHVGRVGLWRAHPARSLSLRKLLDRNTTADYEAAEKLAYLWLRRRGGRHDH